jgi:hypothetical protein
MLRAGELRSEYPFPSIFRSVDQRELYWTMQLCG